MDRKVLLRLTGEQRYPDQPPERLELTTEALLRQEGKTLYLRYQESELTGLTGTTTTFEIRDETVALRRSGAVSSHMEFTVGKVHKSLYETSMGILLITVFTTRIENHMEPTGGNLTVTYGISIEDVGMGEIEYRLVVTPL